MWRSFPRKTPEGYFQRQETVVIPLPNRGKDARGPFLAHWVLVAVPVPHNLKLCPAFGGARIADLEIMARVC